MTRLQLCGNSFQMAFSLSYAQSEVHKKWFTDFEVKNLNSIHNVLQIKTF